MGVEAESTTFSAILGWVIANLRTRKGFRSQTEFAPKVGMPQSSWSRYESGQALLTADQLDRVAGLLGTTASEIMREVERIRADLIARGVTVAAGPRPTEGNADLLFGAALGALIVALLLGN